MLTVIGKILAVLGIVLLVLLGVALLAVLLVLFVPVRYRVEASRKAGGTDASEETAGAAFRAAAKLDWLFGLVRARFCYPDPGTLQVKALCFTVFDSGKEKTEKESEREKPGKEESEKEESEKEESGKEKPQKEKLKKEKSEKEESGEETFKKGPPKKEQASGEQNLTEQEPAQREQTERTPSAKARSASAREESASFWSEEPPPDGREPEEDADPQNGRMNPFEKFLYTIRGICDKIKRIRENLAYYQAVLSDEDTKGLVNHGFVRLGRILKSIRPRKLKADILFGTGSPDTTGYVFALYGMLCAYLGDCVLLVPDFERAVLEGELYAAGRITVFKLVWNGLWVALDKRLWELISKLKKEDD
ncbi:MAG: hypothetical protein NC399_01170 [Muribaculum sp.]|nr:hypothetical protein [Muribaculum sp.]